MIAVQYDLDTDQIWITGEERPYPRRSLIATSFPNGTIGIRLKFSDPSDFKVMTSFANLMDAAGNGFATQEAAQAYLDTAFAQRRPTGAVITPYPLTAVSSVSVDHGLAYAPRTTIVSADGAEVDTDVVQAPGRTTLTFAQPFTGTLYLG